MEKIDHNALIVNQIVIVLLNILAFLLNQPWLAVLVTIVMLIGTLLSVPGFGFVYWLVLRLSKVVKPHILPDNPEPHRFAQGFGGTVMLAGTLCLFLGAPVVGWVLVWVVAILAALNAIGRFCVGCFIYYQLGRSGLRGFGKQPPAGTFPGKRPAER